MASAGCSELTEEQRRRMQENLQKALEKKRLAALKLADNNGGRSSTLNHPGISAGNTKVANDTSHASSVHTGASFYNNHGASTFSDKKANFQNKLIKNINKNSAASLVTGNKVQYSKFSSQSMDTSGKKMQDEQVKTFTHNSTPVTGTCVLISRTRFTVKVGYNQQLIEIFKATPSRMYDVNERKWNFLLEDHDKLVKDIRTLKPSVVVAPLPKQVLQIFHNCSPKNKIPQLDLSSLDPTLQTALMPFQEEGVCFGISKSGRVLIADDMGLGKTIQAIGISSYYQEEWPLLVVVPSSVRYSWVEAFRVWLPSLDPQAVTVLNTGKDPLGSGKVLITSYDLMSRRISELQARRFQVVIMDESHLLKNIKCARTKAAMSIMKKNAKRVILLTGTPALSRPIELFTQLNAINSKLFPVYNDFGMRYCDGKSSAWGMDFSGASHMGELLLIMEETVMIRRLKADVIKQLPPKRRQMVLLDPASVTNNSAKMKQCVKEMSRENLHGAEKRGALLMYYNETGTAKLKAVCDYIADLLEGDRKFLCFAHHVTVMDGICSKIEDKKCKYIRIDGNTKSEDRKRLCDIFQFNDDYRVAVLSITAASIGITLTAAHLVVFAELYYNPGILTQAEDRAHRIGQEDSVLVQYLVARGTADDHLWLLVKHKLEVLNKVGLSKDNFSDADTAMATDPRQQTLDSFFDCMDDDFYSDIDIPNADPPDESNDGQPIIKKPKV